MRNTELKLLCPIQDNPYYKDNPEYFLELKNIIEPKYRGYTIALKSKKYRHLLNWINSSLPLLQNSFYKLSTKCYWILAGLVDFPKCLKCNNTLEFKNVNVKVGYPQYCSNYCQITSKEFKEQRLKTWKENYGDEITTSPSQAKVVQQKQMETTLKNHGVKFPMQSKEIFEHGRQTKLEKYGDKNYVNPEKALETRHDKNNGKFESEESTALRKQTCKKTYGTTCVLISTYGKEQIKKTSQRKYGTDSPNSAEIVKQNKVLAIQERYGENIVNVFQLQAVKDIVQSKFEESIKKCNATKKKRGTFNSSSSEKLIFEHLCKLFPNDVEQQYRSDKYPFNCDFYIKSLDLYIECNFHWTHGGHFFDAANLDDQAKVQKWKDKGTKFYDNAVNTWTVRDVKKQQTAIDNNLNYLMFWSVQEALSWIQQLPEVNKTITT